MRGSTDGQPNDKVSREMRRLWIDANPALGGSGSRKRKRGQQEGKRVSPVDSAPVTASSENDRARTLTSTAVELAPAANRKHHPSTLTIISESIQPPQHVSSASISKTLSSQPWFMPGDPDTETAESIEGDDMERTLTPISQSQRDRDGAQLWFMPSGDEGSDIRSGNLALPGSKRMSRHMGATDDDRSPGDTAISRSDLSGEAGMMGVRDGQASLLQSADEVASRESDKGTQRAQRSPIVAEQRPTKRLNRELRKLLIDANASLGGNLTFSGSVSREPDTTKSVRASRGAANAIPTMTKQKDSELRSPVTQRQIKLFPKDPPRWLVDDILLRFANAAGEQDLLRMLSTSASRAIALDRRIDTDEREHERRKNDVAVMEGWPLMASDESAPAHDNMGTGPENDDDQVVFIHSLKVDELSDADVDARDPPSSERSQEFWTPADDREEPLIDDITERGSSNQT